MTFVWPGIGKILTGLTCSVCLAKAGDAAAQHAIGEEVILGHQVKDDSLTFRVGSGGCTTKGDFGLETVADKPLTVRLLRVRADYCEGQMPSGIEIIFSFAEIGVGPRLSADEQRAVVILNDESTGERIKPLVATKPSSMQRLPGFASRRSTRAP